MTKTCSKCGIEKDATEFYKTSGKRCKVCYNARCIAYAKQNPEKNRENAKRWYYKSEANRQYSIRNSTEWQNNNRERRSLNAFKRSILKNYSLTYEDYCKMVEEQNGECAICSITPKRRLDVDHNHITNMVRQLLCSNCNTAIGLLKEDATLFAKALSYLERHNNLQQSG